MQGADFDAALKDTGDKPTLMMVHNPDAFVQMPDSVAVMFAGHTHGGQVVLPFFGPVPIVIPSRYGTRFVYGHIVEDGKDMIVTSGVGTTGLPIRFMRPPEIAIVTVTGKEED